MPEQSIPAWFFERMDQIVRLVNEKHDTIRGDLGRNVENQRVEMEKIREKLGTIDSRLGRLETTGQFTDKLDATKLTILVVFLTVILNGLMQLAFLFMSRRP